MTTDGGDAALRSSISITYLYFRPSENRPPSMSLKQWPCPKQHNAEGLFVSIFQALETGSILLCLLSRVWSQGSLSGFQVNSPCQLWTNLSFSRLNLEPLWYKISVCSKRSVCFLLDTDFVEFFCLVIGDIFRSPSWYLECVHTSGVLSASTLQR